MVDQTGLGTRRFQPATYHRSTGRQDLQQHPPPHRPRDVVDFVVYCCINLAHRPLPTFLPHMAGLGDSNRSSDLLQHGISGHCENRAPHHILLVQPALCFQRLVRGRRYSGPIVAPGCQLEPDRLGNNRVDLGTAPWLVISGEPDRTVDFRPQQSSANATAVVVNPAHLHSRVDCTAQPHRLPRPYPPADRTRATMSGR